jgi:hypothetical protein
MKDMLPNHDWATINLVHEFPSIDESYDPLAASNVANEFIRLGKEETQRRLLRYTEVALQFDERFEMDFHKVLLLCRILFREKNGRRDIPRLPAGQDFIRSETADSFPSFPLVFFGEMPFLLTKSYSPVGSPAMRYAAVKSSLGYCLGECTFRNDLIKIDLARTRVDLDTFLNSKEYSSCFEARLPRFEKATREFLLSQLTKTSGRLD